MKKKIFLTTAAVMSLMLLQGCNQTERPDENNAQISSGKYLNNRWYQEQQVMDGGALYSNHCASCHKADASGTENWKQPNDKGQYPPPPLNGSAHTWHHPLSILRRTLKRGGVPLGGYMPGFADKLNDREIDAILAWVQSWWNDEIYTTWKEIDERSR